MSSSPLEPAVGANGAFPRNRQVRCALLFLAIFASIVIMFEVAIRHAPADGLVITRTVYMYDSIHRTHDVEVTTWRYTSQHDQAIIDDWNHELHTGPVYTPALLVTGGCHSSTEEDDDTMRFTWRGLPVQVWSATACSPYTENSGGLPSVFWMQPFGAPQEPHR